MRLDTNLIRSKQVAVASVLGGSPRDLGAAMALGAAARLVQAVQPSKLHRPAPGVVEEDPERQVASGLPCWPAGV